MGAVWGFTVETATHALRLILSGVFEEYPRLKIILGHLGEALLRFRSSSKADVDSSRWGL